MMERIFLDMKSCNIFKHIISFLILFLFFILFVNINHAYASNNKVYTFSIKGVITNATADITAQNIKKAEEENVPLLIYVDTPGGILDSTRDIVQSILAAKIPVITYTTPEGARAASAGSFIVLASSYAVMNKSTNIGAAHPVSVTGDDIKGEMEKKIVNDTTALMKSIAQVRNRNIDAAVLMITESKSYTSSEALKLKLIDAVAAPQDIPQLLKEQLNIESSNFVELDTTLLQSFYNTIAHPDFLALMLFLGILFILLEIKMPGTFIFAGLGILCLILFAFGSNLLPINMVGILLIILGFALLVAEIFITSFGALTVGGITSLVFGLKMLFEREGTVGISVSLWLIASVVIIAAGTAFIIGRLVVKDFFKKPFVGLETFVGDTALVTIWNNGCGKITLHGEIWNAVSEDDVSAGDTVEIVKLNGLTVQVKKKQ